MKYMSLAYIYAHSRIDFNDDDTILTVYAESAEETVMNLCNTTYEDMLEEYGEIPKPIVHATLMLVEVAYTNRAPISQTNLSVVPYTFDLLIKPYMVLADTDTQYSSSDEL